MKGGIYLSDAEWALLEPLLPKAKRRTDGRGRPPRDPREVLNGIVWILFSGDQRYIQEAVVAFIFVVPLSDSSHIKWRFFIHPSFVLT